MGLMHITTKIFQIKLLYKLNKILKLRIIVIYY